MNTSSSALLCALLASATLSCAEGDIALDEPSEARAKGSADAGAKQNDKVDSAPVDVPRVVSLSSDDEGRVESATALGAAGQWQESASLDSEIDITFEDGKVCMRGKTAQVLDSDWTTFWGAAANLPFCQPDSDKTSSIISKCPGAPGLDQMVGVRFTLEAKVMPWRVQIGFQEAGRADVASVPFTHEGNGIALFSQALVPFVTESEPVNPARIESLRIHVQSLPDAANTFDFCLSDLEALTGDDWEQELVPAWLREPGPGMQVELAGANLVGAEFGEQNLPGVYGSDYIYPNPADIALYASKGMNVARVPFQWERLQPVLEKDFESIELARLVDTVATANDNGMTVIIDPHNFARYRDSSLDNPPKELIGEGVSIEAFADLWSRLATEFIDNDLVIFGLMNEPHDMSTELWLEAANAAILAIRQAGAGQLVLVPGNAWSGAHNWAASYYGTPNSEAMLGVIDSEDNYAFELHQYMDADSSGTDTTCVSETIGVERVEAVTAWLKEHELRGFLGEFGGGDDPICLAASDKLLTYLGEHSEQWLGWTVWAATEWFIEHNIRPKSNGMDVPQMLVLERHLDAP